MSNATDFEPVDMIDGTAALNADGMLGAPEKADASEKSEKPKMEEITLKFGKGCLGDEFQGKNGNTYREVLVPNVDSEDKRPWQTFVVKANQVHENQFGKGMWCKLPAEGHTTLRRSMRTGEDEAGKPLWETVKTQVSNKELKAMVENYKTKDRVSMKEKLAEKKEELKKPDEKKTETAADKAKPVKKAKEESL